MRYRSSVLLFRVRAGVGVGWGSGVGKGVAGVRSWYRKRNRQCRKNVCPKP